jgi:hypothetical protein
MRFQETLSLWLRKQAKKIRFPPTGTTRRRAPACGLQPRRRVSPRAAQCGLCLLRSSSGLCTLKQLRDALLEVHTSDSIGQEWRNTEADDFFITPCRRLQRDRVRDDNLSGAKRMRFGAVISGARHCASRIHCGTHLFEIAARDTIRCSAREETVRRKAKDAPSTILL